MCIYKVTNKYEYWLTDSNQGNNTDKMTWARQQVSNKEHINKQNKIVL